MQVQGAWIRRPHCGAFHLYLFCDSEVRKKGSKGVGERSEMDSGKNKTKEVVFSHTS